MNYANRVIHHKSHEKPSGMLKKTYSDKGQRIKIIILIIKILF